MFLARDPPFGPGVRAGVGSGSMQSEPCAGAPSGLSEGVPCSRMTAVTAQSGGCLLLGDRSRQWMWNVMRSAGPFREVRRKPPCVLAVRSRPLAGHVHFTVCAIICQASGDGCAGRRHGPSRTWGDPFRQRRALHSGASAFVAASRRMNRQTASATLSGRPGTFLISSSDAAFRRIVSDSFPSGCTFVSMVRFCSLA